MNNFLFKKIVLIPLFFFIVIPLNAEYLFLKDGSIIKGKIVSETANDVVISDEQNKVVAYPHNKILRVLYTEINMGKIYVQLKNGENFRGYLIDEDRDTYTFRYVINRPEEFTVQRSKVLFIAERNPSELKGESSYTEISLTWSPPYDKMKFFNIYLKKKKEDKFIKTDTSRSNLFQLKGLSSNTKYIIMVTGVDDSGIETTPSNEILVSTLNRAPFSPLGLKVTQMKTGGADVEWKPAVDPDGTVVKYKIFKTIKNKRELAGETKVTSLKISGTEVIDKVQVSAVDDLGAESVSSNWYSMFGKNKFVISVTPGVLFPVGTFGEMYTTTFGGMVSFSKRDLFFNCFEGGVSLGFYYSFGKDLMEERNRIYGDLMFVPLYIYAGYNFEIGNSFVIKPLISFGIAYLDTKYYDRNKTIAEGRNIHLQIVAASFKAGVAFEYRFTDFITASVGCEYGATIQNQGLLCFIQFNAGVSFSF